MPVQPDPRDVDLLRAPLQRLFPTVSTNKLAAVIGDAIEGLERARIRNFDVVIVEHAATQELERLMRRRGTKG